MPKMPGDAVGSPSKTPTKPSLERLSTSSKMEELAKEHHSEFGLGKLADNVGLTMCVTRTGKAIGGIKDSADQKHDAVMVAQSKLLLRSLGRVISEEIHDAGEPLVVRRGINTAFGKLWPEIEKHVIDSMLLEKGRQFRRYRDHVKSQTMASWPDGLYARAVSLLLYAMSPYDLSFMGRMRQLALFLINMLFLFPLYGVDSICVIVLWIYTYKVDEYQLTDFIIKSKGLQFITSGLISGALAFFKMYKCSIQEEGSPLACEHKAPGMLPTFPFEFSLLLVRTVLVWITFLILWNFDAVTAWHARRRAKAATSDARRGLFGVAATAALLALTWSLALAAAASDVAAFHATSAGQHPTMWAATRAYLSDTDLMSCMVAQLLLTFIMVERAFTSYPSAAATLVSGASLAICATTLAPLAPDDAASAAAWADALGPPRARGLALAALASAVNVVLSLSLVAKQRSANADDQQNFEALISLIRELDTDGDGLISKAELKTYFHKLFPKSRFEPVWAAMDADGSGELTMAELATFFGQQSVLHSQCAESADAVLDAEAGAAEEYSTARLEAQLDRHASTKLSQRAGGFLTPFLLWDLASMSVCFGILGFFMSSEGMAFMGWRFRTSLYFGKMLIGLFAAPFLLFKTPVLAGVLVHTVPTGYNKAGACVPKINQGEIDRREAQRQAAKLVLDRDVADGRRAAPLLLGWAWLDDRWDRFLGLFATKRALEAARAARKSGRRSSSSSADAQHLL